MFNAEYPMVRWLEANGYDVSYTTGVDTDRSGAQLLDHRAFLSVGHDEYWSGGQRTNVEAARAAGVNLAFFSGNEVFWKTRWENSIAPGGATYRTLVCYKETHANAKIDPLPNVWTGTWRDPRFRPPADGGHPENALTGTIFTVNSGTDVDPRAGRERDASLLAQHRRSPVWHRWRAASCPTARSATSGTRISTTAPGRPVWSACPTRRSTGVDKLQDFGSTYASGTANHALTLYRHASGAFVFGAGTVQWSWGLDSDARSRRRAGQHRDAAGDGQPVRRHGRRSRAPCSRDCSPATASNDTLAPTSSIVSPAGERHRSRRIDGRPSLASPPIQAAARSAGVEVSVDGGATWRRATGRTSWTYSWQTGSPRTVNIRARAVDDSGNLRGALAAASQWWSGGCVQLSVLALVADRDPGRRRRCRSERGRTRHALPLRPRRLHHGHPLLQERAEHRYARRQPVDRDGTLLASVTFTGESRVGLAGDGAAVAGGDRRQHGTTWCRTTRHRAATPRAGGYFAANGRRQRPAACASRRRGRTPTALYRYGATGFPRPDVRRRELLGRRRDRDVDRAGHDAARRHLP